MQDMGPTVGVLHEAYANYLLQFPWDVFWTQTFRHRRNDGHNAAAAWWRKMEGKLGATRAFVAVEKHRLGGVHLHALVQAGFSEEHHLDDWAARYCDKAFGFNVVSECRNEATVSLYCAKYVVKGGEYYFMGDDDAWRMDRL